MGESRLTVVGMGDGRIATDIDASLITYALGSCVAVAVHDPVAKVGAMVHVMLPESSLDPAKASESPYRFADTGLPLLLKNAFGAGADKRRLSVYVAGAAQIVEDSGIFNIGKRNYLAVRKLLWQAGVLIGGEAVGGRESRTVRLEMSSGRFFIRSNGGGERLLEMNHGKISANC